MTQIAAHAESLYDVKLKDIDGKGHVAEALPGQGCCDRQRRFEVRLHQQYAGSKPLPEIQG